MLNRDIFNISSYIPQGSLLRCVWFILTMTPKITSGFGQLTWEQGDSLMLLVSSFLNPGSMEDKPRCFKSRDGKLWICRENVIGMKSLEIGEERKLGVDIWETGTVWPRDWNLGLGGNLKAWHWDWVSRLETEMGSEYQQRSDGKRMRINWNWRERQGGIGKIGVSGKDIQTKMRTWGLETGLGCVRMGLGWGGKTEEWERLQYRQVWADIFGNGQINAPTSMQHSSALSTSVKPSDK